MKPKYHTKVQLRHRKRKQVERAIQDEQNDTKKSPMTSAERSRADRRRKKEQAEQARVRGDIAGPSNELPPAEPMDVDNDDVPAVNPVTSEEDNPAVRSKAMQNHWNLASKQFEKAFEENTF
jgi:hypothetical protein